MKTVVVTGGAGYAGCILVPKLLKKYKVRVIDNMLFGSEGLDSVKNNPKLEIWKADIRNQSSVKNVMKEADAVIHLAAISNDPCSELDPELTKQVNLEANKYLIKIAKESGVDRFINVSTSSVYGIKDEENVTEGLALEPITIYSRYKAETEKIALQHADKNFTVVNIRPATICGYSPRLRLDLTVNILTAHAINMGAITVFGGKQKRPNIHIDDITDYYVKLLEIEKEKIQKETFNAGYENHTIMEIAEMVKDVIGNVKIEATETKDERSYHISSDKIAGQLDLIPKKTIKHAIIELKEAFESGKIADWENINYYNVKKMKALGVG